MLITVLILSIMATLTAVIAALAALAWHQNWVIRDPPIILSILLLASVILTMFGGPFVVLALRDGLTRRILAASPPECWPDDVLWI